MQGLGWEICADLREHNTGKMPINLLVHYAQRKGDVCRRRHEEQQAEEAQGPRPVESVEPHGRHDARMLPRR